MAEWINIKYENPFIIYSLVLMISKNFLDYYYRHRQVVILQYVAKSQLSFHPNEEENKLLNVLFS